MINEIKQGLEDGLCHNDAIRGTQEIEEELQRQTEDRREDKLIRKFTRRGIRTK